MASAQTGCSPVAAIFTAEIDKLFNGALMVLNGAIKHAIFIGRLRLAQSVKYAVSALRRPASSYPAPLRISALSQGCGVRAAC